MKRLTRVKLVEWLSDHGFEKLAAWLCGRYIGHPPVWYNMGPDLEPDMSCKHCPYSENWK